MKDENDRKKILTKEEAELLCEESGGVVVIPPDKEEIADDAFSESEKLISVTIPSAVKKIGARAFMGCIYLAEVRLSEGLEAIWWYAFARCKSLRSIELPRSLKLIEESCFRDCIGLEAIEVPDGVEVIERSAFEGCESLRRLKLPSRLRKTTDCIRNCRRLKEIEIPEGSNISLRKLTGCYLSIGSYEIEYGSVGELSVLNQEIELPTGRYGSYEEIRHNSIADLDGNISVGSDMRGNMFVLIYEKVPCFDSGDFEWDSYRALLIFPHEKGMFALYRNGGYRLSRQRLYYDIEIRDEKTAALLKKAEEEWQRRKPAVL